MISIMDKDDLRYRELWELLMDFTTMTPQGYTT